MTARQPTLDPTCERPPTIEEIDPDFERPDGESRMWKGLTIPSRPFPQNPQLAKLHPSILHSIGFTPVIKLNKIPKSYGITCDVYVKCEFMNPGGSVKDRIGYRMVLDAEEKGLITEGTTVIEATSGNTGIGVALACAVRGYPCIIVMAEKNSNEKVDTLKLLGAQIVRTPTEAGFLHQQGIFAVSQNLRKRIPNSVILGQYSNPGNYMAHYDGTGSEILWQFDNDIDMVVAGAGTGGTVTGVGKRVKEGCAKAKIVSFDPYGSILARPEEMNESDVHFFEVEGLGYDFIPSVLKHEYVDQWYKSSDAESFQMARRLCREEGLLCGGSSGSALVVAMKAAKELKEGQRCVVVLPDGIRNYMTKFVSENWCQARDFLPLDNTHDLWWWNDTVADLGVAEAETVDAETPVKDVLRIMREKGMEYVPVVENGSVVGITERKLILDKCSTFGCKLDAPIKLGMEKKFFKVKETTSLARLAAILRCEPYALVTEELDNKCGKLRLKLKQFVTRAEFLDYVAKGPQGKQ